MQLLHCMVDIFTRVGDPSYEEYCFERDEASMSLCKTPNEGYILFHIVRVKSTCKRSRIPNQHVSRDAWN